MGCGTRTCWMASLTWCAGPFLFSMDRCCFPDFPPHAFLRERKMLAPLLGACCPTIAAAGRRSSWALPAALLSTGDGPTGRAEVAAVETLAVKGQRGHCQRQAAGLPARGCAVWRAGAAHPAETQPGI